MSRCFQADAPHPSRLEREINHRSSARGMGRRGLAIRHRLRICAGHRHRRRRVWESRRWKQDPLDQDPDPVGVGPAILRERQPAKVYERAQKRILVRNPALCSAYAGRTFGRAPGPRNLKRRHRHYRDVLGGRPDPVQLYFVWLATQRRAGWPRWVLAALLLLCVISLLQTIGAEGVHLVRTIEIVSCALTAVGLCLSFTGDARGWFNG
jgi:hypothetical protein